MKKLFIFLVIVAVIGGFWYTSRGNRTSENTTVQNSNPTTNGHPSLANAVFTIDGEKITLKKGVYTDPTGAETDLTDTIAYGDLNSDGKEDAAVVLVQSGAGSGVFLSVAAYVSGPVSYKGSNMIILGDRIQPKSISIKNNQITVTYLDRKPDEPFASDPTVLTTKTFTYSSTDNSISE